MPPTAKPDGSSSTQTEGGMSRADASRARLAAQRERLAQQRARLSGGGSRAASIQRTESGTSIQSTMSSAVEQPAPQTRAALPPRLPLSPQPSAASNQAPEGAMPEPLRKQAMQPLPRPAAAPAGDRFSGSSEDDKRPLQSRTSGTSDGSRSSGLLSPGVPRSRSAAIDVPTSPNRARRSPRYTPYEQDPYLQLMHAPAADPVPARVRPVPAVPAPGKAGQPELSPVPEVIDTGFASIDSKQKASQLFKQPARASGGAEEGALSAQAPSAQATRAEAPLVEVPRRKKKEEGSAGPCKKPSGGPVQGAQQPAASSALAAPAVAPPQPPVMQHAKEAAVTSPQQQESLLGSTLGRVAESEQGPSLPMPGASLQSKGTSQEALVPALEPHGSAGALGTSTALQGDLGGVPAAVDVSAPSQPSLKSPEAATLPPYLPPFGSVIAPAPEDEFWRPAAEIDGTADAADSAFDEHLQDSNACLDFPAPAGEAADTDLWASVGGVQQPGPVAAPQPSAFEQQQRPQQDVVDQPVPPDAATGSLQAPSTAEVSYSAPPPQPALAQSQAAEAGLREEGKGFPQDVLGGQSAFPEASEPFSTTADVGFAAPDPFASSFPSGQDEDTSFFDELGAPGPELEPFGGPTQELSMPPPYQHAEAPDSQSWQADSQQTTYGQPAGQQVHSRLPVGLQPQPEWKNNQHSVSSLQQNAPDPPALQDAPFGHQQGLPSYGQAAYEPASYSEAAPEPAFNEPQPPGVLQAPAWPGAEALERAPSGSDPYAAGGQNYYGAGWQAAPAAGTPEKPAPPKVSGPGWGKLGFWGTGQPVKEPEQPAQDHGVLYYGAPEANTGPPPPPSIYTSQMPVQNPPQIFGPPPFAPAAAAQPQHAFAPVQQPRPMPQSNSSGSHPPPFASNLPLRPVPAQFGHANATPTQAVSSSAATFQGSNFAPLVMPAAGQSVPWQSSASGSLGQPPPGQHAQPWQSSAPAGRAPQDQQQAAAPPPWQSSALGSFGQPEHAQPWQSSAPAGSTPQHQQPAAAAPPGQAPSEPAVPPSQHAHEPGAASSNSADQGWAQQGSSTRGHAHAGPQPPAQTENHLHVSSQPQPAAPGQAAQASQWNSAAGDTGFFGAADTSEADFWGQQDAEDASGGLFGNVSLQQHSYADGTSEAEQEAGLLTGTWDNTATHQGPEVHGQDALSTAPDGGADVPSTAAEAVQRERGAAQQELQPASDTQGFPAAARDQAAPHDTRDTAHDAQPVQEAFAGPDEAPAETPFGSEEVQGWQTAELATPQPSAEPLPGTSMQQQHAGGHGAPQEWPPQQDWRGAEASGPAQQQVQHEQGPGLFMHEQQAAEQPHAQQAEQAWSGSQSTPQQDWHVGGASAQHASYGNGQYTAQATGDGYEGGLMLAQQDTCLAWQGSQEPRQQWQGSAQGHEQEAAQHSVPQQGPPFYAPEGTASPGALFKSGQNAWAAQQRRMPSEADEGLVPGSAAEALRVTHGRPPCALISFGIGGRVAILKPTLAHGHGTPVYGAAVGLDSRWLPGQMAIARRGALAACLGPAAHAGMAHSFDEADSLMQRFPGPLTSATPREKVLAFLDEQAAAADQVPNSIASTVKAMWAVLRMLVAHNGSLRAAGRLPKGKPDEAVDAELAAALVPDGMSALSAVPAWQAHGYSMAPYHGNGKSGGAAHPGSAVTVQKLLLEGKKAEALRAAVEGCLWGPALMLARAAGEKAFAETAAAMAAATAGPGSPLASLLLMLSGSHDLLLPVKPSTDSSPSKPRAGSSFNLKGLLTKSASKADMADPAPEQAEPSAAELAMLADWHANLAALASFATSPADEALIARLGDRLWEQQGEAEAAHLCYLVAGVLPQVYEPGARMCLLGADHRGAPHTLASVAALQRTEILEWAKLPGMAQPTALALPLLPYKLLYAYSLAEYGHLAPALQYLGLLRAAMGSLGNKMPAALLVCSGMAADLEQRLRAHAAAFNVSVKASQSSSFIGGLGRLLDKGINRLISGDLPPSGPPSTGSEADPFARQLSKASDPGSPQHRRSGSAQHNGSITPVASFKDLASASQQAFAQGGAPGQQQGRPVGSPSKLALGKRADGGAAQAQAVPPMSGGDPAGPAASGPPSSGPSSIRSMFSGLGGLLGTSLAPAKKEAKLGAEENTFFYDQERKMWRERGAEIPADTAPLPPPPSATRPTGSAAPSTGGLTLSAMSASPVPIAGPPPPGGQMAQPFMAQQGVRGASSRYVNTMSSSAGNRAPLPMLPPLVPSAPSATAVKPPGSFFVPAPAAQRPNPADSPAQELASQPFDTDAPAQIPAEDSPLREDSQGAFPATYGAPQTVPGPQAEGSQAGEGRKSSGFGQWLSNGGMPGDSQAVMSASQAPPGSSAQPEHFGQGSQASAQGQQPQQWSLQPAQPSSGQDAGSMDVFAPYAAVMEPVQNAGTQGWQTHAMPGQSMPPQAPAFPSGPAFGFPAGSAAPRNEEMKEIEL